MRSSMVSILVRCRRRLATVCFLLALGQRRKSRRSCAFTNTDSGHDTGHATWCPRRTQPRVQPGQALAGSAWLSFYAVATQAPNWAPRQRHSWALAGRRRPRTVRRTPQAPAQLGEMLSMAVKLSALLGCQRDLDPLDRGGLRAGRLPGTTAAMVGPDGFTVLIEVTSGSVVVCPGRACANQSRRGR
jgi:hypothetical protein